MRAFFVFCFRICLTLTFAVAKVTSLHHVSHRLEAKPGTATLQNRSLTIDVQTVPQPP